MLHSMGNMEKVFILSFVDNFQITAVSETWQQKVRLL